ncbi:MAG TPA: M28 family peptidase [Pyrinomonadaceae bacterium]|nr:M28 family peptidase [Acidobacteriota bacterium]HQZ97497.1 M28 family peptidase [Pyrinomonadaceae bacterium]
MLVAAILSACLNTHGQQTAADQTQLKLLQPALDAIRADTILEHIKKLASDEFEGRGPGTRGETLTVNYLVDQFKRSGVRPGNPDGTFVQKVPLIGSQTTPEIEIEAGGQTMSLKFLDEFVHDFPSLRRSALVRNTGVVFAGYGIVAPEFGWDDYKGVDVRNKLVIVLSGEPSQPDRNDPKKSDSAFFKGDTRTYYSTREAKYDLAGKRGAAGVLVVYDPDASKTYSLFQTFAKMEGFGLKPANINSAPLISGLITIGAARRLFALAGQDLDKLQTAASRPDRAFVQIKAKADISVKSKIRTVISHNVVARVEGSDPKLKNEYVIYSAHWDHLGKDTNLKGDQIYNGAQDNAVGTAQLLEVARGFARLASKPKRSILLIAVTAEEKGFLGSRYYAQHPLFPVAKTVANINLDGGNVWGVTADLITTGYGLSTLDEFLAEAARIQGRKFIKEAIDNGGLYFGSDQIEFAKVGIPACFPFSGSEYIGRPKDWGDKKWEAYSQERYHQVSDEVKLDWDLSGAAEDAKWLLIAGFNVAQAAERPVWKLGSEFKRRK